MTTPERIKQVLIQAGVEEKKIARTLADLCGISPQSVYQWFDGSTNRISPDYLAKIAYRYNAPIEWLITGKHDRVRTVSEPVAIYTTNFDKEIEQALEKTEKEITDDMLNTINTLFPTLPKSSQHALISLLYQEVEKHRKDQ